MSWGGTRAGAGRPAKGPIASEPHKTRPLLASRHPVHVRTRIARAVRGVPRARTYRALRRALRRTLARDDFRIVQLAVRATGIEMIVEAEDKDALARGMQGFQVSAARWLNREARRHGCVFLDRYWMNAMRTRSEVRAVVGSLPVMLRTSWPQTWLARVELITRAGKHWMRTRADEDS